MLAVLVLVAAIAADLSRPPERQVTTAALLTGVHAYQHTFSRLMPGFGIRCRFEPTCSRYSEAVLRKHGALRGSWLTLRRLLRCGPWTPMGTRDEPV